jgi:hypothetical protein
LFLKSKFECLNALKHFILFGLDELVGVFFVFKASEAIAIGDARYTFFSTIEWLPIDYVSPDDSR